MNNKAEKIIIFLGAIFAFFLNTRFISALEIHYPTILGYSINDTSSLSDYMCYLFGLGTTLALFITVIIIAYGGVYYLVSYGRGKFTDEGKEWIKAGITGLLVVILASLIIYTINPNLTTCKLLFLPQLNFNSSSDSIPPGVKITTYKEVPIGTLTETLLTRTTACYGFDQSGNPIDGDRIRADNGQQIVGPTYMNNDRVDCIAQLFDGAQKKAQLINDLSKAIKSLMDKCVCDGTKCTPVTPDCNTLINTSGICSPGGPCSRCQKTASCTAAQGETGDCCPTDSGIPDPNNPYRNLSGREQIEHGPVKVTVSIAEIYNDSSVNCATIDKTYKGLDEFRSEYNNNYEQIKNRVEETVLVDEKPIDIINTGNCTACNNNCTTCNPGDAICLQTYNRCINDYNVCKNRLNQCHDNSPWYKLKLIDQLTYFKGKAEEMKQRIEDDRDVLDQAKSALSSPQCYLSTPYIDLLKTYETTNQQDHIILTNKTFSDPETGNTIDASKYCQGFNYDNSSCLKKCNDMCPDTSSQAIQLYKKCGTCQSNDTDCLAEQEACIEDAYNSRPCPYRPTGSQYNNFGDCINSCQDDCKNNCAKKYPCSNEYNTCKNQCDSNSQCVLDNADQCLFGAKGFVTCANQTTDQGNTNYCINNAYSCKAGSNEYAGYSDCVVSSIAGSQSPSSNCSSTNVFSSSFLYSNPQCQKCPVPNSPPISNTVCYSSKASPNTSCQTLCPETAKCPAASYCSSCPCNEINTNLSFSVPNPTNLPEISSCLGSLRNNNGNPTNKTYSEHVSAYRITGPQCIGYSYNDDPLTYYCQDEWWNDPGKESSPVAIGQERFCPAGGEVPVGQTVDSADAWALRLINTIEKEKKDIQDMVDFLKKIGDAYKISPIEKYCECDAQFENNDPVCTTDCVTSDIGSFLVPCAGKPCMQIMDYLSKVSDYYGKLKTDFIDFYITGVSNSYGRSDIMKQLTYSRQMTNKCSATNSIYGAGARLLSCTRVEDELIPPINTGRIILNNKAFPGYCYGVKLGESSTPPSSLMDNWFCCEEYSKNPTTSNNPIYNIQK